MVTQFEGAFLTSTGSVMKHLLILYAESPETIFWQFQDTSYVKQL